MTMGLTKKFLENIDRFEREPYSDDVRRFFEKCPGFPRMNYKTEKLGAELFQSSVYPPISGFDVVKPVSAFELLLEYYISAYEAEQGKDPAEETGVTAYHKIVDEERFIRFALKLWYDKKKYAYVLENGRIYKESAYEVLVKAELFCCMFQKTDLLLYLPENIDKIPNYEKGKILLEYPNYPILNEPFHKLEMYRKERRTVLGFFNCYRIRKVLDGSVKMSGLKPIVIEHPFILDGIICPFDHEAFIAECIRESLSEPWRRRYFPEKCYRRLLADERLKMKARLMFAKITGR